jgi:hypothetical protein
MSRTPITARSAWRPRDFPSRDTYTVALGDAHLAALDSALAVNRAVGRALEDITADDFALPAIAHDMADWRDEVLHGRGFVVLRALSTPAPPFPTAPDRLHDRRHRRQANSSAHVATRRPCQVGPSRTNAHSGFLATSRRAAQTAWNVGTSASAHSKYVRKS